MSWKDPRTASPKYSIWRDLSENEFRQHLVTLEERTNCIPMSPKVFSSREWAESSLSLEDLSLRNDELRYSRLLSLDTEQQIADDFACLVAVAESAQSVAAVCIEEQAAGGMILRFAAVDLSLNVEVKNGLQKVMNILSSTACCVSTKTRLEENQSDDIEKLYDQVLHLHHHRLLARLRSSKWEKPKYLSKSHKKPLWQDFDMLHHRAKFAYTKRERNQRNSIQEQLSALGWIYQDFEHSTPEEEFEYLKKLVYASHSMCSSSGIKDFLHRLRTQTQITSQISAAIKSLRQIQKIAAYRRISISLVQQAQNNPPLFKDISIQYLIPYSSVPTTVSHHEWAKKCHVHVEVQLAVYYDLHSSAFTGPRPRTIGTSKWLCFLCYQFLCAQSNFFPSKTHGQLYDQWTVPDLQEFEGHGGELVAKYRGIVRDVDRVMCRLIEEEPEMGRLQPMTSCTVD